MNSCWPALRRGQGTEMRPRLYSNTIRRRCRSIIAKHICSRKLAVQDDIFGPNGTLLAFILYNVFLGINLLMEYNEVHFIIVIIYRVHHYSRNPAEMKGGINEIALAMLFLTLIEFRMDSQEHNESCTADIFEQ